MLVDKNRLDVYFPLNLRDEQLTVIKSEYDLKLTVVHNPTQNVSVADIAKFYEFYRKIIVNSGDLETVCIAILTGREYHNIRYSTAVNAEDIKAFVTLMIQVFVIADKASAFVALMVDILTVIAEGSAAIVAEVIRIAVLTQDKTTAVTDAVVVLVGAHIFATGIAEVTLITAVVAFGQGYFAYVAEMVAIVVGAESYETNIANAVLVFVYTHISATFITVMPLVLAVDAKRAAAQITGVILITTVTATG